LWIDSLNGSPRIGGIGNPESSDDAATKDYVDSNFLALKPTNEQTLDFAEAWLDLKNL
jgi:hypothetical protein